MPSNDALPAIAPCGDRALDHGIHVDVLPLGLGGMRDLLQGTDDARDAVDAGDRFGDRLRELTRHEVQVRVLERGQRAVGHAGQEEEHVVLNPLAVGDLTGDGLKSDNAPIFRQDLHVLPEPDLGVVLLYGRRLAVVVGAPIPQLGGVERFGRRSRGGAGEFVKMVTGRLDTWFKDHALSSRCALPDTRFTAPGEQVHQPSEVEGFTTRFALPEIASFLTLSVRSRGPAPLG